MRESFPGSSSFFAEPAVVSAKFLLEWFCQKKLKNSLTKQNSVAYFVKDCYKFLHSFNLFVEQAENFKSRVTYSDLLLIKYLAKKGTRQSRVLTCKPERIWWIIKDINSFSDLSLRSGWHAAVKYKYLTKILDPHEEELKWRDYLLLVLL